MYQGPNKKVTNVWISSLLRLTGARLKLRVQTKTADYSVLNTDTGTIFTTYGDGDAINFTLPVHPEEGLCYLFVSAVDYAMTITAGTADTLITHHDTGADSVDFDQTDNMIGQAVLVLADGTKYYAVQMSAGTFGINS